jgi:hypothetical protein
MRHLVESLINRDMLAYLLEKEGERRKLPWG